MRETRWRRTRTCVHARERLRIVCQAELPPLSGSDAKGPVVLSWPQSAGQSEFVYFVHRSRNILRGQRLLKLTWAGEFEMKLGPFARFAVLLYWLDRQQVLVIFKVLTRAEMPGRQAKAERRSGKQQREQNSRNLSHSLLAERGTIYYNTLSIWLDLTN